MIQRKLTKQVQVGDLLIGAGNPIRIQSMTNTDTRDIVKTVEQIHKLQDAGCEIIRCTVPNNEAALALGEIKKKINIPIVADIHFDYRLAIAAMENGADKIRINPGNIGSIENVKKVVEVAKQRNIPIRVGVNGGSLAKEVIEKYGKVTVNGLVESAYENVKIIENLDYDNIVISLKVSNVNSTIQAYETLSNMSNYPLHIGVTEAGTFLGGTVKNTLGIGILLSKGIGDTLRVSLTDDPVQEVKVGWNILKSLEIRSRGVELISCPTCGRTRVNMIEIANKVEQALERLDKDIKVAVMGCAVNGPGEAREADIGVACGDGCGLIFKKGEIVKKVDEKDIEQELLNMIKEL